MARAETHIGLALVLCGAALGCSAHVYLEGESEEETPQGPPGSDSDPAAPGTLSCGDSWWGGLPALPEPAGVPPFLDNDATEALVDCEDDPVVLSSATMAYASRQTHTRGKWYFEVTVKEGDPLGAQVSVFASPSSPWDEEPVGNFPWASAFLHMQGQGAIGAAVDLDAGRVSFYQRGELVKQSELLLVPGVGPFHAGVHDPTGSRLKLNLGSDPFIFEPPPDFQPWAGGERPCESDPEPPAQPAPIYSSTPTPYPLTSFRSNCATAADLVILGIVEGGAGEDELGRVRIELTRRRPVDLVLSGYEATEWTLVLGPGADVRSVTTFGYRAQVVVGSPVPVDSYTALEVTAFQPLQVAPHQWPYDTVGGDTLGFVRAVEDWMGRPLNLFGGRYHSDHFRVQ